jgi:hypothetical protein
MYDVLEKLRELDKKNPNVHTDALENTEKMNAPIEEAKKKAKPDFLDVDKDGDKKEPMKKALKDKEKTNEAKVEMCPEACCGKPVTECKCGPDCEHCDCYEKNKATKESVNESITVTADSPEDLPMLDQIMKLAGMNQVTSDMMPGADNVPVMKGDNDVSCGCGGDAEYDNAPNEQYSEVDAVTTNAGIEGVNGKKAPQDIRVKDPSPYEDFEVGRLQDLAGIESDDEVEEEWDNEPDELYKDYDGDEYANNAGGATRKTHQVPARSGDNPLEGLEDHLRQAYEEFMAERKA